LAGATDALLRGKAGPCARAWRFGTSRSDSDVTDDELDRWFAGSPVQEEDVLRAGYYPRHERRVSGDGYINIRGMETGAPGALQPPEHRATAFSD